MIRNRDDLSRSLIRQLVSPLQHFWQSRRDLPDPPKAE